jgi:PAS domain
MRSARDATLVILLRRTGEMLLSDRRLRFARDLIGHWAHLPREGLVPFEEDVDPGALLPLMPFITLIAVAQPTGTSLELVFPELSRRWGRDMRKADYFDFLPPEHRAAAEQAKRLFISVPCGAYHRFAIWADSSSIVEAERLSLPLRRRGDAGPTLSISLTRDLATNGIADRAPATPPRLERIFAEFVDIGAGAPPFPPIPSSEHSALAG